MTSPVQPGDVMAGKYRVERILGEGGMGVVVLATHIHLEQQVALKFLLPEALKNAEAIRRFVQEARAAAHIQSEHVVRVHDVAALEDGAPYLVMEYLEGSDLSTLIRARGPLPFDEAVDYILQASEAIAEAHVAGIIHRDLKPANLFVSQRADGTALLKVLDFGISKLIPKDAAQASMTKTRALMGSPLYMSPEQMRSTRNVSPRSDIWALGIILYESLTNEPPFASDTMPEICARVLDEPLPPLREKRPDVPADLEAAIMRCTEKDPKKRFQTCAELAQALTPFASQRGLMSIERISRVMGGVTPMVPPAHSSSGSRLAGASTPGLIPPASGPLSGLAPVSSPTAMSATEAQATFATFSGSTPKIPLAKNTLVVALSAVVGTLLVVGIVAAIALRPRAHPPLGTTPTASVSVTSVSTDTVPTDSVAPKPPPTAVAEVVDAGVAAATTGRKPRPLATPHPSASSTVAKPTGTAAFGHSVD